MLGLLQGQNLFTTNYDHFSLPTTNKFANCSLFILHYFCPICLVFTTCKCNCLSSLHVKDTVEEGRKTGYRMVTNDGYDLCIGVI